MVMQIIQLSHVLQGEIVQVFFFIRTHTLILSCRFSSF